MHILVHQIQPFRHAVIDVGHDADQRFGVFLADGFFKLAASFGDALLPGRPGEQFEEPFIHQPKLRIRRPC